MKKAVFLDRDGVINKNPKPHHYVKKWNEFEFLPNVAEAIRRLNKEFLVIVISNQGGIAKRRMSVEDVEDIHKQMRETLQREGARIDAVYYCPHHPEGTLEEYRRDCPCRKPNTGLIKKAVKDFSIDLGKSFLVGDSTSDILAGRKAGLQVILVETGLRGSDGIYDVEPDFKTPDLLSAAEKIMALEKCLF